MRLPIAIILNLTLSLPAFAIDLPPRKAGLWELTMAFEGRQLPSTVMKHCIDAATDKLMNAQFGGQAQEACSKQDITKSGNSITIDSVCKFSEATTTSHAVMTGNFDSAYTVEVTSTSQGGRPIPGQTPGASTHMKIAAKYLGACEAGQKPGDVVMPNGMKMNVLELPKMGVAPAPPKR